MREKCKATLLISIKPKFAERIFAGTKKVELRRKCPRLSGGDRVMVYISSPIKALAGQFTVERLLQASPDELWTTIKDTAGVTRDEFDKYYRGTDIGYAIFLSESTRLDKPIGLEALRKIWEGFHPPQSYLYLTQERLSEVVD